MKHFIFPLLILSSTALFGQNWKPVSMGEKFNYQHPDSILISHTVWVDSVRLDGQDSVFFLNRVVIKCPACPVIGQKKAWLRNQGQFLQKQMRLKPDGQCVFEGNKNLLLRPFAGLGENWIFNAADNINATILAIQNESVFGTIDSVKTIALSNGISFKLSKSFGLLSFPEDSQGNVVSLVGIEGRNLGALVPGFRQFVDFQPGDVFQYYENYSYSNEVGHDSSKFTILKREESGNTLRYYAQRDRRVIQSSFGHPSIDKASKDTLIWSFSPDTTVWLNHYPEQLYYLNAFDSDNYTAAHLWYSQQFGATKTIGTNVLDGYPDPFSPSPTPDSDTMRYWFFGKRVTSYSLGLGLTSYHSTLVSGSFYRDLIGYVKNGDTTGFISPNYIPNTMVPTTSINSGELEMTVLGNPAKTTLALKIFIPENEGGTLEIFTSTGLSAYKEKIDANVQSKTIPLSRYSPGIYFIRLTVSGQMISKKVILIP